MRAPFNTSTIEKLERCNGKIGDFMPNLSRFSSLRLSTKIRVYALTDCYEKLDGIFWRHLGRLQQPTPQLRFGGHIIAVKGTPQP